MNKQEITAIIFILIILILIVGGISYFLKSKKTEAPSVIIQNHQIANSVQKSILYKTDFNSEDLYGRLYKSEDEGRQWKEILKQYKGKIIYAVDPKNSSIIYAGDVGGNMMSNDMDIDLVKSIDAGDNWTDILKLGDVGEVFGINSLMFDDNDSNIIRITAKIQNGEIKYKSLDGGSTWIKE
jgi:hypothetical protein